MPVTGLADWMDEFAVPGNLWYLKRLSGNDTLANGSHQAGPYIPKSVIFAALPSLPRLAGTNPRISLEAFTDIHPDRRFVSAIWYNNLTRDEARVTNWGGGASALLDPESTGALAVFVFVGTADGRDAASVHIWVCEGYEDEVIEDRVGPVDPGKFAVWRVGDQPADLFAARRVAHASCRMSALQMPPDWLTKFPSGAEIVRRTVDLRPLQNEGPDARLLKRRECEYELFRSVEEAFEMPAILAGFSTIDDFVERALSVLQRRKARSGRSLELHARAILIEEGFRQDADFCHGGVSEGGKRPDFMFPTQAAYRDMTFPPARLRMLATKTTLKDRWRQILNEADRIGRKHLLTLQEGVSIAQSKRCAPPTCSWWCHAG